jgi:hypothetical protein
MEVLEEQLCQVELQPGHLKPQNCAMVAKDI